MAAELHIPPSRALDANGNPYSGAKWHFYATGTTTPQNTFTTSALSVAHANPVVADAGGNFAAIYFDASLTYRGVLKDSTGAVTIHDIDPINPGVLGTLSGSAGSASVGFIQAGAGAVARTVEAKLREVEVSVRDFMSSAPDGTADNTAALQAAVDSLTAGGVVKIPRSANAYRVSQVTITVADITIRMEAGATIKKHGSGGGAVRGVFTIANLLNANFTLELNGGIIDLNGEGPTGIGTAGRIANTYAAKTIASILCITGPANSAVYSLRSSHMRILGPGTIKNTGESAVLWRNSSDVLVKGVKFANCANWGIELSIVDAAGDGGTGTMPDRSRFQVRNCYFEDCDDYGLASGNGGGIGGGGANAALGALYGYEFTDNEFVRCLRDIHIEFALGGTWLDGVHVEGVRSTNAGQGSIGFIGARRGSISKVDILNPGQAPQLALTYQVTETASPGNGTYPESYGLYFSLDFDQMKLSDITVADTRTGDVVYAADGVATASSTTFTSAGASFAAGDVGKTIGIIGVGPSAIAHVTTIATRVSATEITLTKAPSSSLASAKYAYGGCFREGIVATGGASIEIENVTINGGATCNLTSEPDASAIRLQAITGFARVSDCQLKAASNGATQPAGLRMVAGSGFSGKLWRRDNRITGYSAAEVGTYTLRASVIGETDSFTVDKALLPSATINTYGTEEILYPDEQLGAPFFRAFQSMSLGVVTIGAETITFAVTAYYFDSGSTVLDTITFTTNTTTELTARHFVTLNPDGVPIRAIGVKMKSSIGTSPAGGRVNLTAVQA